MHQLLVLAFSATGLLLILIIACLGFRIHFEKIWFRILLGLTIVWILLISTKYIPDLLIENLEKEYLIKNSLTEVSNEKSFNILILGAGFSDDPSLPPNDQIENSTLGRLCEGVRVYRTIPGSKIVTGSYKGKMKITQGDAILNAAIALGVSPNDTCKVAIKTNNTVGEITGYFDKYGTSKPIILVTDAVHMPRAMMICKHFGLNPIPAPTNHIIKHSSYQSPFSWLPSLKNIENIDAAIHEYMGIAWFKLGGYQAWGLRRAACGNSAYQNN
jgi:uncharacterized SAM-binding protein YcdF (DUF218 family)